MNFDSVFGTFVVCLMLITGAFILNVLGAYLGNPNSVWFLRLIGVMN